MNEYILILRDCQAEAIRIGDADAYHAATALIRCEGFNAQ